MSSTATGPVKSLATTALMVVAAVFPILSIISIIFRYRARRVGRLTLNLTIGGLWSHGKIITFGVSINAWVFGSIMGVDYYKIDSLEGQSRSVQCLWAGSLFLQPCLATVKVSILCFYKRIFSTPKFKIVANFGIALVVCRGVLFFFLIIFQVTPVSATWTGKGHFNVDGTAFGLAQAGTSIALDVIVLGFPLPVIHRLHMRTRRKVAVGFILWLGSFCCVAAIVRFVLLQRALSIVAGSSSSGYDYVYIEAKAYIFTIVEPNCSIIAPSLPCYGPLFAGGRAPESLVRSARSVFSLRSQSSSGSGNRSSAKAADGEQAQANSAGPESQIELTKVSRDWANLHSQGHNTVHVEPLPHKTDEEVEPYLGQGIAVTKTYEAKEESV